jgi:two-component system sensor histidine kinase UhpB
LVRIYHGFNQMVERLALSEAQNKRLQQQLTSVQDEERADLARDLHDEIGPLLFAADVDAVAIEQLAKVGEYDDIPHRVGIIREAIGRMQRHVRDILGRLRSAMLLDVGLAHAIDNLVAFWRSHRPKLNFRVDVPEESFGELIDGTIYRIVQESLSNAIRHGSPSLITIEVTANSDRSISIRVTDDGSGLKNSGRTGGFGIVGMQERVATLGGSLDIANRRDGAGVIVSARLPAPSSTAPARTQQPHEATLQ